MRFISPVLCGCLALAQTPSHKLAFEVVSIKHTTETMFAVANSGKGPVQIDNAQAVLRGMSLSNIVQMALNLPDDQITGPAWMADQRFEINAKLPAGSSKEQVPEMLQSMLAERFQMIVHHEQKVRPVYSLVIGKGPLTLKEADRGSTALEGCNGGRGGHHDCHNVTMEDLASILTQSARMSANMAAGIMSWGLDRPVVDKTGLKGKYDFTMDYGAGGRRGGGAPADGAAIPIADAVKALGLSLEPGKLPFDIVVIDHLERNPTEN